MARMILPWVLFFVSIIVRLVLCSSPATAQRTTLVKMTNSQCPNRCEKPDPNGYCRLSILCLLTSKTDTAIIVGGGCPHCRRLDPLRVCRVVISCIMGYKGY